MDITTIKYPSHNDLVKWYYQLAQHISDSTGVTPEQVNELIDAYIAEHPYPVVPDDIITQANAAANVVTSVNGEKGDVTVTGGGDVPDNVITEENIEQNAVTSFNGAKGAVTGVSSVNGQTGDVTTPSVPKNVITTDDIGQHAVTSFNGQVGDIAYPYTPIYPGANGFIVPLNQSRAIAYVNAIAVFDGIDLTYNVKFDGTLFDQVHYIYSCVGPHVPGVSYTIKDVSITDNLTLKIWLNDPVISGPPYPAYNFRMILLVGPYHALARE